MTDTPSLTPEEIDYRKILMQYIIHVGTSEGTDFLGEYHGDVRGITEAEEFALRVCRAKAWASFERYPSQFAEIEKAIQEVPIPNTPFLSAVSKSPSFKEGQIITGKGLKPSIVTIAKDGTVVLVPKCANQSCENYKNGRCNVCGAVAPY